MATLTTLTTLWVTAATMMVGLDAAESSWNYQDVDSWPGECGTGRSQSPIDVQTNYTVKANMHRFYFSGYHDDYYNFTLKNNGHAAQLDLKATSWEPPLVYYGGLPGHFAFAQLHFHWGQTDYSGSEHTVNGDAYPLEMHLVHFNVKYGSTLTEALANGAGKQDALAVLGVLFEVCDTDNEGLAPVFNALAHVGNKDDSVDLAYPFALDGALPPKTNLFYRYQGSLTTPDCNEIVVWTLFKYPAPISPRQLEKLRQLNATVAGDPIAPNYRPTQPVNGRTVHYVNTNKCCSCCSMKKK